MKKFLASVIAITSMVSCISAVPAFADYKNDIQSDSKVIVPRTEEGFGTILEENYMNITGADCYTDKTIFYFKDGKTLNIDTFADDLIITSQIQTDEYLLGETQNVFTGEMESYYEECYYIVGYAVNVSNNKHLYVTNNYTQPNEDFIYECYEEVILPDGTIINGKMYDVQAIYNLDGEYMGYRTRISGQEDGYSLDVFTTVKQDDKNSEAPVEDGKDENGLYSVPTDIRGDINYDGLVNNIDVMVLRKYILHLIEW